MIRRKLTVMAVVVAMAVVFLFFRPFLPGFAALRRGTFFARRAKKVEAAGVESTSAVSCCSAKTAAHKRLHLAFPRFTLFARKSPKRTETKLYC